MTEGSFSAPAFDGAAMTDRTEYHLRRAAKERKLSVMTSDSIARLRHFELAVLHDAAAQGLTAPPPPRMVRLVVG